MHTLYPLADYQIEIERRQDEMADAKNNRLAHHCHDGKKLNLNLSLRLVNFLLLLVPFIKR